MLRYLSAQSLHREPLLSISMFQDRARQFKDRLNWSVTVDQDGQERDDYDMLDPLYVIWQQPDGRHGGSLRFLPTMGPCMVNDHFRHLSDGNQIKSPLIWECTRFCIAPGMRPEVTAALMLGACELGLAFGLTHAVAVFGAPMVRIYRTLGWGPVILGSDGEINVGLFEFSEPRRRDLCRQASILPATSRYWLDQSLGEQELPEALALA